MKLIKDKKQEDTIAISDVREDQIVAYASCRVIRILARVNDGGYRSFGLSGKEFYRWGSNNLYECLREISSGGQLLMWSYDIQVFNNQSDFADWVKEVSK